MESSVESTVINGGEKESDKLLSSQDANQNGKNVPAPKSPKQSPQNLAVQKKDVLTVSSASHSSLSRPSDVPTLRITEDTSDPRKTSIKRRILKVAVTIMFLIMAVGVIIIWSLHDGGKEDKQAKFFFFHANDLYLKSNTEFDTVSLEGSMGGQLFVVPGSDERDIDTCNSNTKWCFTWKEKTVLHVDFLDRDSMQCMSVFWQNVTSVFPSDCYQLRVGFWFGMGGKEKWLANKNKFAQDYYLPGYDEQNGDVYEFYLLSSFGTSLYIKSEDPFLLSLNETSAHKICISPVAVGPRMQTSLSYEICQSNTIRETHSRTTHYSHQQPTDSVKINLTAYETFSWKIGNPDELLNVTKIIDLIDKLENRGHACGKIELGYKWEAHLGDFEFDPSIEHSLKHLKNYDCKFILPLSPVVSYMSNMFDYGIKNGLFVQYLYQKSVRMYNYDHIHGALLDLSVAKVQKVIQEKMLKLAEKLNIGSFKVSKLPVSVHTNAADGSRFSASGIFRGWMDVIEKQSKKAIMHNVYRLQDKILLVEVESKITVQPDNQTCIINPLPTVFTLGIDGYPFVMSTLQGDDITAELLIRWLQYSVYFTGLTFPSETLLLKDGARLLINKAKNFRHGFVSQILRSLHADISNSQPILLPLWWYYSEDETVFEIQDQFLFNETVLIAPIFCADQTTRDIYLPAIDGIWSHPATGKDYKGSKWLRNFPVGLDYMPYFKAKNVY